jgi:hypothetical protein
MMHGLGFFDGSNLLSILIVKGYHPDWKSLIMDEMKYVL